MLEICTNTVSILLSSKYLVHFNKNITSERFVQCPSKNNNDRLNEKNLLKDRTCSIDRLNYQIAHFNDREGASWEFHFHFVLLH